MPEQVSTVGRAGREDRPSGGKTRKGLVIGMVGGFLTAGAVVLALNGAPPFTKKGPTLSLVALIDPVAKFTFASGINDAGQIVGSFQDANGHRHAFLYSGGTYTTFDVSE